MNQGLHRLVFSRRLGMAVAVGECARRHAGGAGRRSRIRRRSAAVAAALLMLGGLGTFSAEVAAQSRPPVVFAGQVAAPAQTLPQPYGTLRTPGGGFVNDPALRSFVANPAHRDRVRWELSADGRSATLHQGDVDRVILNWDRFDIGAGHRVHFAQNPDPTRYVSALNRIWSADPSLILGSLTADREVILVNANGVYFGRGARVDTGKFVATALNIADTVFERGLRNVTDGSAVFAAEGTDVPATNPDAAVSVESGAVIRSAAGGDVLLIAPRVVNAGRIDTPQGQSVLAAGQRVYLMSSSDPAQRGLIVAVDPYALEGSTQADPSLGLAENLADGSAIAAADGVAAQVNEIRADSGRVNIVGLTVRQAGVINATTAVKGANGVVMLQAMDATQSLVGGTAPVTGTSRRGLVVESGALARVSAGGGSVEFAPGSLTQVLPDSSGATQLPAEVFNPSLVYAEGERIAVGEGALVQAPAGRIELLAASSRSNTPLFDSSADNPPATVDDSRVVVAPGARISVAGAQGVAVDGARNQGSQRLFRIELADAPVQRDGPLYRQQVFFDARDAGRIEVADVSGAAAATGRTAAELSTRGGKVRIESEGVVLIGEGAELDVSGGSVRVSAVTLQESQLVRDGAIVRFSEAVAGARYDGLLAQTRSVMLPAYEEGRDGGTLVLGGRRLAVGGTLQGQVVEGERQAAGLDAAARPASLVVGRAPAVGGRSSPYLPGLDLVDHAPALAVSPWTDPLDALLDMLPETTALSLRTVAAGGFGRLELRAAGLVQPDFFTLDLGRSGELDILAKSVALDGVFLAPGGALTVRTDEVGPDSPSTGLGDISLSARSRLDVAGLWTNNTVAGGATEVVPAQLDGGLLQLQAAHDLRLAPGAWLDVSGGARLSSAGALDWGDAGAITLASGRTELFSTRLDIAGVVLRGFDAGNGGTLAIGSPDLWVGNGGASAEGAEGFDFRLAPGFFSAGGFGRIAVDAYGDVRIASGTLLEPVLASWLAAPGQQRVPSGRMGDAVATAVPVDKNLAARAPVDLALQAGRAPDPQLGVAASDLVVERGATLRLEAGGTLALSAAGSLSVGVLGGEPGQATRLEAPGGTIRLTLLGQRGRNSPVEGFNDPIGFDPAQVLWFGAGALQSVAGTAELRPDPSSPTANTFGGGVAASGERLTGEVLGGGLIEWQAQRGYVVAEAGSTTVLDGVAASVHLPGSATPVLVARPAGRWSVSSPEGVVLDGSVSARAPADAGGRALADGGTLDIAIGLGGVGSFTAGPAFPAGERVAFIGEHGDVVGTLGAVFGQDLSATLGNGVAYVPLALLAEAGFDQWRLGAGDRVHFEASARLGVPIGITLDAPVLSAAPGAEVTLAARTLALGDRTGNRNAPVADAGTAPDVDPAGATRLHAQAQTLDVAGRLWLQGFSDVHLDAGAAAGGELRLSAVNPQSPGDPTQREGLLAFDGTLRLDASRTYATTASLFTVDGSEGSRLALGTGAGGAAISAPMSVFGELVLRAGTIDHQGVLWQPFGALTLSAREQLLLGKGSLTSVSGAGTTRLYGSTENLSIWQLPSQGRLGTDRPDTLPLDKAVTLDAPLVEAVAGATVDVAGGGDVLAWEFFPGVGGSSDLFETPGLYAVLPDFGTAAASALSGGLPSADGPSRELVVTMEGSGLARGAYTLLPARYALLGGSLPQGAFLVRRADDQGGALLGAPQVQDDGSVIITGSVRAAGSVFLGPPGERFEVLSQSVFAQRSDVRLTSVGTLLEGYATAVDTPPPPRPVDGGALRVQASGDAGSSWRAGVAAAADGGRAGTLDIAATRLALVDSLAETPEGFFGIEAGTLAGSGAGSVLIGGRRAGAGLGPDRVALEAVDASGTQALRVDLGDTALALEELILASSGTLEFAEGSRLAALAQGTLGPRQLVLNGDGALAFVSANTLTATRDGVTATRDDATLDTGTLALGANSALAGTSVGLDATATLVIAPSTALDAGRLALTAPGIALGGDIRSAATTVITGPLLEAVQASESLTLRGYRRIDFVGVQDWTAPGAGGEPGVVLGSLTLDAPLIRVQAAADGSPGSVRLAAREIELRNSAGAVGPSLQAPLAEADSALQLLAMPPLRDSHTGGLSIGPGMLTIAAADVQLRSRGDIVLSGEGGLDALGDLMLAAARLTATSAAEHTLQAQAGTLRVAVEPDARTLGETVGLGASVSLQAQTLLQDGHIVLPSGALSLQAEGAGAASLALRLGAGSTTSVAGQALDNGRGFIVDSPAGTLALEAGSGAVELSGGIDAGVARRPDGQLGEGDGGRIRISATGEGGALRLGEGATLAAAGGGRDGDRGGHIALDLRTLADAAPLLTAAGDGGIDGSFALRVREGELVVTQDLRAGRIELAADGGALRIDSAALDARAADGGLVRLAARDDLTIVAGSRIDVQATRNGAQGGEVLAASRDGVVRVEAGAGVEAGDGRITLRAPRTDDGRGLAVAPLDAAALQAAEVVLEAVRVYEGIGTIRSGGSAGSTLGMATVAADNAAFAAAASGALAALGVTGDDADRFSLRAGVEVRSDGDLTLASAWNLAAERPGGHAGALTLRAAGHLTLSASLSDGFVSAANTAAPSPDTQAWSMRLIAGADLDAADPLATRADDEGEADLRLGPSVRVRTGAGSVEMAAARDVLFGGSGNTAAAAYVAGAPLPEAAEVLDTLFSRQAASPLLTGGGLRLTLQAGRDVVAAEAGQLVNNWLWRSGLIQPVGPDTGLYAASSHLAWWTQFSAFAQTLGAFGGAGLQVQAGRDIVNLQAMLPTVGWADSRDPVAASLQVRGGGDLDVLAGRDLLGGQFLVAGGLGRLEAGRHIGGAPGNTGLVDVQLAQMNGGQFTLQSRLDLGVGGSFNPTAAPPTTPRNALSRYFYTWGEGARLELRAAAGKLTLDVPTVSGGYGLASPLALQGALRVLPPELTAYATGGRLQMLGTQSALLFPAAGADLLLWAAGDLQLGTGPNTVLAMADSDPASWPDYRRLETFGPLLTSADSLLANALADALPRTAVHASATQPARLHAGGSLLGEGLSSWLLPKPARLSAGLDILNLRLLGQNLGIDDRTELVAGRNLLAGLQGLVELGGPGVLDVRAGRDVNLGSSEGIVTIGNRKSAALPSTGASVRLAAATSGVLDLAVLDAWRQSDPEVQALLTRFVRDTLRAPELEADAAWQAFQGFAAAAQAELGRRVLADAFRRTYLDGPPATTATLTASLREGFEQRKADILEAGEQAAAAVESALAAAASARAAGDIERAAELTSLAEASRLPLPGGDLRAVDIQSYAGDLRGYLATLQGLNFESLDLDSTISARLASLQAVREGWQAEVAAGRSTGDDFERFRERTLQQELAAVGSAAASFGRLTLPMRLALFDQGFAFAELAGVGSFVRQQVWQGAPLLRHEGALEMTQSAIVTERGGDISLINPGGAINVGLKDAAGSGPKGVIALAGGDVFGYARDDFQVNVQRVFIVGEGDMAIWSSAGDIDSGRGANTAVAAPPLAPRRSADGVVFEIPATTTGSGLGILPDVNGRVDGSIGLYPAFGEILALDAFIRAPRIELGATVRGADNLGGGTVSGAAAAVTPPPPAVSSPPPASAEERGGVGGAAAAAESARDRQSLLTVELLGTGPGEPCEGLTGQELEDCRKRLAAEAARPSP
jgi:filamentous hemagglutinin